MTKTFATLTLAFLVMTAQMALAQSPPFTYQGELSQSGAPADGLFDFQFSLFDSPDFLQTTEFAGPLTLLDQGVAEGTFSIDLDFGPGVFGSMDLWLEVRVRESGSAGAFTTLEPRQQIGAVPLALVALEVEAGAIGSTQISTGGVTSINIADGTVQAGDVDTSQIQQRIAGLCSPGNYVRAVQESGALTCGVDSDTTYTAGSGILLNSNEISLDDSQVQRRIADACQAGSFVTAVNADGTLVCESRSQAVLRPLLTRFAGAEIVLRNDGRPFLAIMSTDASDQVLAYDCFDNSCEQGELRLLDSEGSNLRPYLRTSGLPAVLYEKSGQVYVFDCADVNCVSGTARITALSQLGPISQTSDGQLMVFFTSGSNLGRLICDDDLCSSVSGQSSSLQVQDYSGLISPVAVTSDGLARVAYRNTNGKLGLLICRTSLCGSRIAREIVVSGIVDTATWSTTSVAIQGNGNPVLAFRDAIAGELTVYTCSDAECSAGVEEDVAGRPGFSATVLAGEGQPTMVVWYGSTGDSRLWFTRCLDPTCASAPSRVLDDQSNPGRVIRAVLRADGTPFIASYRASGFSGPLIYSCSGPTCPTPLPTY